MPRYFFHLKDHAAYEDTTGTELPDDAAASREAASFVGEVLRDDPGLLWGGRDLQALVLREDGTLVCAVVIAGVQAEEGTKRTNQD